MNYFLSIKLIVYSLTNSAKFYKCILFCQECSYIFSQGGGKALADELNVKYLGG